MVSTVRLFQPTAMLLVLIVLFGIIIGYSSGFIINCSSRKVKNYYCNYRQDLRREIICNNNVKVCNYLKAAATDDDNLHSSNDFEEEREADDDALIIDRQQERKLGAAEYVQDIEEKSACDSFEAWDKMTVVQLKDELRNRGLKVSGRKAELIERLLIHDSTTTTTEELGDDDVDDGVGNEEQAQSGGEVEATNGTIVTDEKKRLAELTGIDEEKLTGLKVASFGDVVTMDDSNLQTLEPSEEKKLLAVRDYLIGGNEISSSSTLVQIVVQNMSRMENIMDMKLERKLKEGRQKKNELLPFDISHINSITMDETWNDVSKGIKFVGRTDFTSEVASKLVRINKTPPTDAKEAHALVYSTVSGGGKTVSMLQLKNKLPSQIEEKVIVAYLGFNCNLELGDEEYFLIKEYGQIGAKVVLARRLLASVLLSKNYDTITRLPNYSSVYGKCSFPTVEESKNMLIRELGASPTNRFCIVAGVDEVQRLDRKTNLNFEEDGANLGRFFIRTLRMWQNDWFKDGLTLLPLGTGVTLNFTETPTIGVNTALSGGDKVLISKEDFRKIVTTIIEEMSPEKYQENFGQATRETVIGVMSSAYWPRVRILEYWKSDKLNFNTAIEPDSNSKCWPVWLKKWMRDEPIDDKELMPGKDSDCITALFQLVESNPISFSVIPDGYSSLSMVEALKVQMPVPHLYDKLEFVKKLDPKEFMVDDSSEFEKMGFSAVGASLYIGLHALTMGEIKNPSDVQNRRLGLALWIQRQNVATTAVPMVLNFVSLQEQKNYYPFRNNNQTRFLQEFVKELQDRKPLYIYTGKNTCCDYLFLYPTQKDDKSWVAIVVDAKQTVKSGVEALSGSDQKNVYKAAVCLKSALEEVDMCLTEVRLFYLTNRDELAESSNAELVEWRGQADQCFQNIEAELLDEKSFEFSPISDVLFSRRQKVSASSSQVKSS